ncbi:MAG: hypothetical protein ACLUTU_20160 [Blautia faecis]
MLQVCNRPSGKSASDEAVASGNAMGAIIISSKGDNDNLRIETLFAFR